MNHKPFKQVLLIFPTNGRPGFCISLTETVFAPQSYGSESCQTFFDASRFDLSGRRVLPLIKMMFGNVTLYKTLI